MECNWKLIAYEQLFWGNWDSMELNLQTVQIQGRDPPPPLIFMELFVAAVWDYDSATVNPSGICQAFVRHLSIAVSSHWGLCYQRSVRVWRICHLLKLSQRCLSSDKLSAILFSFEKKWVFYQNITASLPLLASWILGTLTICQNWLARPIQW